MMEIAIFSLACGAAILLAALMGFAIQRGATCTVAAIEEVLFLRRWQRFLGIFEAALWVLTGLLLAAALGITMGLPTGYAVSRWSVLGGALLGLGACINGACVFGAVARIGSGEWGYLATPLGFYLGCLIANGMLPDDLLQALPAGGLPTWLARAALPLLSVGIVLRLLRALLQRHPDHRHSWRAHLRHALTERVWQPGAATVVIGIAFIGLFVLVGAWAYTDVLKELAHGGGMNLPSRCLLVLALLIGAVLGGRSSGRLRARAPGAIALLRCLSGGILMGVGGGLIPGGNDGLLLLGMPLLWPYAWTAFTAMALTIVLALWIGQIGLQRLPWHRHATH